MSTPMFHTVSYRGHYIHCKYESDRDLTTCQIQRPDLSLVKGNSRSLEGAKKRVRKLVKQR